MRSLIELQKPLELQKQNHCSTEDAAEKLFNKKNGSGFCLRSGLVSFAPALPPSRSTRKDLLWRHERKGKEERAMRISVKSERNNLFKDWPCILCGKSFELDDIVKVLFIDGEKTDHMICDDCAADVQAGRTARISQNVIDTADRLQWLAEVAHSVGNGEEHRPL